MSEERPTTPTKPKITRDMPQSPPMLMRRKGQLQRLSNKDRFKIDIFDLHKSLSSDITGRITLDTILDFMNNNKSGSIDYLTKKLTYIEYIHQNINMFEDDFEIFSQIIDLYESIENIKTAIKLFKSGITGVLRAGLDKKYYAKYLKYKKKYLALKNQLGGNSELDNFSNHRQMPMTLDLIRRFGRSISNSQVRSLFNNIKYDDEKLLKELNESSEFNIEGNLKILQSLFNFNLDQNKLDDYGFNAGLKKLISILTGEEEKRRCSVPDFMSLADVNICNNPTLVRGSCSHPGFFDKNSLTGVSLNNDDFLKLFELINNQLDKDKQISIVVGALYPDEKVSEGDLIIHITPASRWINLNDVINDISLNGLKRNYFINAEFPLNTFGSNKTVLDKIIDMSNKYKITFYNKICGSCFRSMYYLTNESNPYNFNYIVNPKQGLDSITDTPNIRKCFKLI